MHLLDQAHEQDIWAIDYPVICEMLLCLRPYVVVRGREGCEELSEGSLDLSRELRHGEGLNRRSSKNSVRLIAPASTGRSR